MNAAIYTKIMTGAASVNLATTYSEAIVDSVVCGWAFTNLVSTTADSSTSNTASSGALVALTTGTTVTPGFAVGACIETTLGQTFTWAVLTENEDACGGNSCYSTADAASTGASMANSCDPSGSTNDVAGAAAAFH
jgi:hypothetical protein